jgi:Mn2+/Fe2+ NRAMP family transporter
MGWMPAPLELSSWTSMWSLENDKANNSKKSLSDSLFDFNVGYIVSVILAICFLGLGASVMYGSGDTISGKAVVFASQLLSLYTEVIGSWSKTIIAFIMFATMLSTVITCVDAYPRALAESLGIIRNTDSDKSKKKYLLVFQLFVAIVSSVLIVFFTQSLTLFVDLVTIISFISSPIVALLNFMIVRESFFPVEHQPSQWLNYLSYIGIAFFFGFAALFLYSKLFMS